MSDIGDILAGVGIVTVIALIGALLILGPFIFIWCISLLWGIPPQYDLIHWIAGFIFIGFGIIKFHIGGHK